MYHPDRWMLVYIDSDDPHYRVFGSWYGGYLHGDSWRLNSGIKLCVEDLDRFVSFIGSSGSVYRCHRDAYGVHGFNRMELDNLVEKSEGRMRVLEECPDLSTIQWEVPHADL
jgi:hypothetical protein